MSAVLEAVRAARERLLTTGPVLEAQKLIDTLDQHRDVEVARLALELVQGARVDAARVATVCAGADGLARLSRELGRELVRVAIERADNDVRDAAAEVEAAHAAGNAHDDGERQVPRAAIDARARKAGKRRDEADALQIQARAAYAGLGL